MLDFLKNFAIIEENKPVERKNGKIKYLFIKYYKHLFAFLKKVCYTKVERSYKGDFYG